MSASNIQFRMKILLTMFFLIIPTSWKNIYIALLSTFLEIWYMN